MQVDNNTTPFTNKIWSYNTQLNSTGQRRVTVVFNTNLNDDNIGRKENGKNTKKQESDEMNGSKRGKLMNT